MSQSVAQRLAALTSKERRAFFSKLSEKDAELLEASWAFWARPEQRWPDGAWRVWALIAGRGFGKTRTGAENVHEAVLERGYRRVGLVAETAGDIRRVMVEGPSGILATAKPGHRPVYEPSKTKLTWPNGAVAYTYSADKPDQLRGPEHDLIWADEVAKWRYRDAWDQLSFGLRRGNDPRAILTTTPRPKRWLQDILRLPDTVVTRGSTRDNSSNLAAAFLRQIVRRYEGTTLGRQELDAEMLDEMPGALWKRTTIERWRSVVVPSELSALVVAVDPAVTALEESDETGIVVCGADNFGRGWVLEDLSGRFGVAEWARVAIAAFDDFEADYIVAEVNQGGDLVEHTIAVEAKGMKDRGELKGPIPTVLKVRASRGKRTRAEPIASLYEQGRVSHAKPMGELEDQLVNWIPGDASPDRMDALVWGLTAAMLDDEVLAAEATAALGEW